MKFITITTAISILALIDLSVAHPVSTSDSSDVHVGDTCKGISGKYGVSQDDSTFQIANDCGDILTNEAAPLKGSDDSSSKGSNNSGSETVKGYEDSSDDTSDDSSDDSSTKAKDSEGSDDYVTEAKSSDYSDDTSTGAKGHGDSGKSVTEAKGSDYSDDTSTEAKGSDDSGKSVTEAKGQDDSVSSVKDGSYSKRQTDESAAEDQYDESTTSDVEAVEDISSNELEDDSVIVKRAAQLTRKIRGQFKLMF